MALGVTVDGATALPVRILTCGDRYVVIVRTDQAKQRVTVSLTVAYGHHNVGQAAASHADDHSPAGWGCSLDSLHVAEPFRNRGLGRMLLRLLEHQLLMSLCRPCAAEEGIELHLACNASSRGFFEGAGFNFPTPNAMCGCKTLPFESRCRCSACVDGWLSMRMREQLVGAADMAGEALLDFIQESEGAAAATSSSPCSSSTCWPLSGAVLDRALKELPCLRCLPPSTQTCHMDHLFLTGFSECFFAVCDTLRQPRLPSIHSIMLNWQSESANMAAHNCFLDNGGSVQLVLWHVLQTAFDEAIRGGGDSDRWMDAEGLPSCPNDHNFDLAALHLLGPGNPPLGARAGREDSGGSRTSSTC